MNEDPTRKYIQVSLGGKSLLLHRVVWFHVHGSIPENMDIDHIDNNTKNNSINNLQCLTRKQNICKSIPNRQSMVGISLRAKQRKVKAYNLTEINKESVAYASINECSKDLNINPGIIKYCCEKMNRVKSGVSKLNNHRYRFEYTDEEVSKVIPHRTMTKGENVMRKINRWLLKHTQK